MRPRIVVTGLGFALCAGAIAWGVLSDARTAHWEALLAQIESAEDRLPFEGVREAGSGAETVRLRIVSREGRKRVEFLGLRGGVKPLPGPRGPRVPFFGGMPIVFRPGEGPWKKRIKDLDLAVRNYDVVRIGPETVAGRAAEVIELRPRFAGRPGYRVAADLENRFPLCFQVVQGPETIFESRFESIAFPPAGAGKALEEPPRRPGWLRIEREECPREELPRRLGYALWLPSALPPGFEARGSEILRLKVQVPEAAREAMKSFLPIGLPRVDVPVAHVHYTDGLAAFSVVECPAGSELWKFLKNFVPSDGPATSGGRVVVRKFADRRGSAFLLELGGTVVVVAGNVSAGEIERIIPTFERR
jgi:negative regulator of sigma E activity